MSIFLVDPKNRRRLRRITQFSLIAFAAVSLSACQTASLSGNSSGDLSTASLGEVSIKETAEIGKRWRANKSDARLGRQYAARLKALGQTNEQMQVLEELARANPEDSQLQTHYGKELVVAGQNARGQAVLTRVVKAGKADWKAYSALGSALDQQGKHTEARSYYDSALKSRPGEISIMNNMAMSHLLEGNLSKAEEMFKKLDAMPASSKQPRIRQNLALSVGLQGRFDEARDIASRDLPPEAVEANLGFLKKMLAQSNTWQKLQPGKPQPTSG
ncbi:MAG: tetratricopeptide repeat protein [Aestuariivirgaceae bacterium]